MRTRTSNAAASPGQRRLHEPSTQQSLPAAQSHRCLAASGGRGNNRAEQPPPQTPGLPSQATAVPSPSVLADNGRFTAGCRCWITASLWEGGGIQPSSQITASGEARRCPRLALYPPTLPPVSPHCRVVGLHEFWAWASHGGLSALRAAKATAAQLPNSFLSIALRSSVPRAPPSLPP